MKSAAYRPSIFSLPTTTSAQAFEAKSQRPQIDVGPALVALSDSIARRNAQLYFKIAPFSGSATCARGSFVFSWNQSRDAAVWAFGAALCLSAAVHAQDARCAAPTPTAATATAASTSGESILSSTALPRQFAGDDPEQVRDALAAATSPNKKSATNPTIAGRVRGFLARPFHRTSSASVPSSDDQSKAQRTFAFVIPASYGVRFQSKKKLLSVNVSLAAPEQPDVILLKRKVEGQSGRKLVIAPEAKAKGFIQTIDTIQLQTDDRGKTSVRGTALLPDFDPSRGNGDFAIMLVCSLEPPYLSDRSEHSDPTDEEPTDITRRTSTLHGRIDAVWLIDRNKGTIVTRRLRLVK